MKILKHTAPAAMLLACSLAADAALAVVILDRSPDAFPGADFSPGSAGNFSNIRSGQHFADDFSFASNAVLTGMDIYSGVQFAAVGDTVTIQLFADATGSPGAILAEFTETIDLIDFEGISATTESNRKHVDFTSPLNLVGGTTYWIGMSGGSTTAALQLGHLMLEGAGAPDDGTVAQFSNNTLQSNTQGIGDAAMRLHGTLVGVPEPATLGLLVAGLLGAGWARQRRAA